MSERITTVLVHLPSDLEEALTACAARLSRSPGLITFDKVVTVETLIIAILESWHRKHPALAMPIDPPDAPPQGETPAQTSLYYRMVRDRQAEAERKRKEKR